MPTNRQRLALLPQLAAQLAQRKGLPLVRWRYPIPGASALTQPEIDSLYERYPALSGYFVKGAAAFMTVNLNPNKGFANGTPAIMHSLSWQDARYTRQIARQLAQAKPGEIVDVQLPLSVNVEVTTEYAPEQIGKDRETVVPGRIVLPLERSSDAHILVNGQTLSFKEYCVEMGCVVTFHKCQGKTMSKIILDLNKPKKGRSGLTYSSLYVGLSRVRSGDDVKLFPLIGHQGHHLGALEHLLRLQPNGDLKVWPAGHDSEGRWSLQRSLAAGDRPRGVAPKHNKFNAGVPQATAASAVSQPPAVSIAANSTVPLKREKARTDQDSRLHAIGRRRS